MTAGFLVRKVEKEELPLNGNRKLFELSAHYTGLRGWS
jgi:hypothetical protein